MTLELLSLGLITGFASGFFGIGGGMLLVPLLLLIDFTMKEAISISVTQMMFSSIYGSFLNSKKAQNILKDGLLIGCGGFIGGLQSSFIISNVSENILKYIFIFILILSIVKIFTSPNIQNQNPTKKHNKIALFFTGFFIGTFAISIGIGGSILLTPILVGFLHYELKVATSLGLFFVVFSSVAGFISMSLNTNMLYLEGFTVGFAALIGVFFGIKVKHTIKAKSYKQFILILYIFVLFSMIYKTFI